METHCFLTHNWANGNHERVSKINDSLKKRGFITWFDAEKMDDLIRQVMANGLAKAACVVVFVTRLYETKINAGNQDDNCFFEFDYSSSKVSGLANYRIAAATEKEMSDPNDWIPGRLAAELGTYFVLDMTSDEERIFESQVDELATRIIHKIEKRAYH
jgi:hypothetical protein